MRLAQLLAGIILLGFGAAPALADRGGNGHNNDAGSASCTYADGVVSAVGLPTDEVINFLATDATGMAGWVLGMSDGTWSVVVPPQTGPTSYAFVSRTWGPNGSKYKVFASC